MTGDGMTDEQLRQIEARWTKTERAREEWNAMQDRSRAPDKYAELSGRRAPAISQEQSDIAALLAEVKRLRAVEARVVELVAKIDEQSGWGEDAPELWEVMPRLKEALKTQPSLTAADSSTMMTTHALLATLHPDLRAAVLSAVARGKATISGSVIALTEPLVVDSAWRAVDAALGRRL